MQLREALRVRLMLGFFQHNPSLSDAKMAEWRWELPHWNDIPLVTIFCDLKKKQKTKKESDNMQQQLAD